MEPLQILKVLLVDDDRIYQFVTKKGVQTSKLSVEIVSFLNGSDALAHMEQAAQQKVRVPDIIFLDINMPVMNGFEFLEAYKGIKDKFSPPVPIYVVSSSADITDRQVIAQYPFVKGYLVKPVEQKHFMQVLSELVL
jgi:CheY-like chemotaxis protein